MTRYIVNAINPWPLVTLNFFGETYFEYIQHFTHWAHCDWILPNIKNVPDCLATGYIGVRWLGTFKMYSACAHWTYLGHTTGTGDKGPNTHWVHGENIEITVNM